MACMCGREVLAKHFDRGAMNLPHSPTYTTTNACTDRENARSGGGLPSQRKGKGRKKGGWVRVCRGG